MARSRQTAEHRKLLAETARQASLIRAILEIDPGAIAIYRGPELRLEMANPSFRALLQGRSEAELVGKTVDELFPSQRGTEMRGALDQAYQSGQPIHFHDLTYEAPDGGERNFTIHMLPIDSGGPEEERGIAVVIWEVTEQVQARRRAEELAQETEGQRAWLQTVIDQMPEGVTIASAPDGDIMLINRAARELFVNTVDRVSDAGIPTRYGLTRGDGSSMEVDDLPLLRAIRKEATTVGEEHRFKRSDGKVIDLLVNAAPLYDVKGKLVAGIVIFQDITQIKDVERLKDEFMSVASHELRTPLTNIRASAQLLLRRAEQSHASSYDIHSMSGIVQQASRMARLIDELLDVNRLQSGALEIHPSLTDLSQLLGEVVESHRITSPQFEFDLSAPEPVWANIDKDRMAQVFGNLLDNAVKYSIQPGTVAIELRASPSSGVTQVRVTDKGIGFDPEHGERIFERFSRLASVVHHSQGMGMGLYIARQIVEAHGGSISGHSEGHGRGATFTVTIPLANPSSTHRRGDPLGRPPD
jgi:PAS domain S-box-containing protein